MEDEPERWLDGSDLPEDLLEALADLESEKPTSAELAQLIEAMPGGPVGGSGGSGGLGAGAAALLLAAGGLIAGFGFFSASLWSPGAEPQRRPSPAASVPPVEAPSTVRTAEPLDHLEAVTERVIVPVAVPAGDHTSPRSRPRSRLIARRSARAPAEEDGTSASTAAADEPIEPEPTPTAGSPSEAALLISARRALAHSPRRALELTEQHRRLFAAGALVEEREVVSIEALFLLGRTPEARRRAERFLAAHPGSIHRSSLRSLLTQP